MNKRRLSKGIGLEFLVMWAEENISEQEVRRICQQYHQQGELNQEDTNLLLERYKNEQ